MTALLAATLVCALPQVVDGDTIRCAARLVRLVGMDAPEMPGHCRRGRLCVPGNPFAARDQLRRIIRGAQVTLRPVGQDRYGRTLAIAWATRGPARINLACHQIATGHAVYVPKWDRPARDIARACAAERRRG